MYETIVIGVSLTEQEKSDENLAVAFNKQVREITRRGGELKAYVLLSDYTNQVGSRFVKFMATFYNLDSDVGISGKWEPPQ